jgi:hypothetical protein
MVSKKNLCGVVELGGWGHYTPSIWHGINDGALGDLDPYLSVKCDLEKCTKLYLCLLKNDNPKIH